MSENIKQNREKIKLLSDQMAYQLKNNPWTPDGSKDFYNKHFGFRKNGADEWEVKIKFDSYSNSDYIDVSEFMSWYKFLFYRLFYVKPSLNNYTRIKKEAEISKLSDKFFSTHKDISRDTKLDQILNK